MKPTEFKKDILLLALLGVFVLVLTYSHQKQTPKETIKQFVAKPVQTLIEAGKVNSSQAEVSNNQVKSIRVPVLMFHHVGPVTDPAVADMFVSASDFEDQVKYFYNRGYKTVSIKQVYEVFENNDKLPPKPIVFTFDDGYADVFANATPILEKYGFTASLAIATELLGRPGYAAWADVINAQKKGMEVVSHTQNHLDLASPKYSDQDLHREVFESREILEGKLGVPVEFFVYPYGSHNDKVVELVKQAGYKMAFTTAYGMDLSSDKLLVEPRVRVHGQDGLEKLKKIFGPSATASP